MEFDFYTKYRQLDTAQLLALVAAPEKMQAAALESALRVLEEREISGKEIEEYQSLHQTAVSAAVQKRKERKASKFFDYLESTFFVDEDLSWDFEEEHRSLSFSPEEKRSILHKLSLLLLVPALQLIIGIVGIISLCSIAIEYSTFNQVIFFNLLVMLLSVSFVGSVAWFLLKRKKGAWSVMLIYMVYSAANNIFRLYQLTEAGFDAVSSYQLIIYMVLTPLGIYSIFLLNKNAIIGAFAISRKRIENTWAIAIIFPVVLFFILYLYS